MWQRGLRRVTANIFALKRMPARASGAMGGEQFGPAFGVINRAAHGRRRQSLNRYLHEWRGGTDRRLRRPLFAVFVAAVAVPAVRCRSCRSCRLLPLPSLPFAHHSSFSAHHSTYCTAARSVAISPDCASLRAVAATSRWAAVTSVTGTGPISSISCISTS